MSALGSVFTALKTLIAATPSVTSLLAAAPAALGGGPAIYDDGAAPQPTQAAPLSTLTPWLTIGAGTEIQSSALRKRGWNCTLQVKVTALGNEAVGQAIVRALSALLAPDGGATYLTVVGFESSWVDDFSVQSTLVSTIGGAVTREWPIILRVYAK
jgi:hypothetical protein